MKILMLVFNRRQEGTYYRAFPWARELARRGRDVTLACLSPTRRFQVHRSVEDGVRILETPRCLEGRGLAWRLSGMNGWGPLDVAVRRRELVRGGYDLVQAFEHHPNVVLPLALAGRRCGAALVSDSADHYGEGGLRDLSTFRLNTLYRRLGRPLRAGLDRQEAVLRRRADAVTVISGFLRDRAEAAGASPDRLFVIPGSADTDRIRPLDRVQARAALGLDADRPMLLFFGAGQFDVELCLQALALVRQTHPAALLVVLGPADSGVRNAARRLGLDGHLLQTGWKAESEIPRYLAAADLCLMPLADHPVNRARWPNKMGAYMAAGRAVVASDVGDAGRVVREREIGAAVPQGAPAFAAGIRDLLDQPERAARLGAAARRLAESSFSVSAHVDTLENAYTAALRHRGERS